MGVTVLRFTDISVQDRTYIDAMAGTIIDKSDGDFTDDKAFAILHSYGYENWAIAKYAVNANQKAKHQHETSINQSTPNRIDRSTR